ncbi:hypothetical protein LTR62_002891 [Meristemomyces frigidus]|uniref:Nucleoside transporter n=1 Tax=Meristemomyces frigidus TaxID=1508187 RepID=A0AAN7TQL7_9PEZI|nr:hypothetical protein LTR62_002891 [Meristemomyces frigidus]
MDRITKLWRNEQAYEPLEDDITEEDNEHHASQENNPFSYIEYTIFLLLGISMLWAWNMFLAAGPYFQSRFRSNAWILENFQAAEISVSTATTLGSMLILTRLQANASYPKRIIASLVINMVVFTLLALFTKVWVGIATEGYFAFLMVMMFASSLATGLCQNGIFAYVSGFGHPSYTQGIMTGQGVAGVLPCIAQIVSVMSVSGRSSTPQHDTNPPPGEAPPLNPNSALAYFLTATVISAITLLSFLYLIKKPLALRALKPQEDNTSPNPTAAPETHKPVPLLLLARKLFWLASAVFTSFAITMVFPVFTQQIVSVRAPAKQTLLFQPASFIPLAFLFWNTGDLLGRLLTAVPSLSLVRRPRLLFALAVSRVGFVGLYQLCNIRGRGAVVESDLFYLVVVQLLFGLTAGYTGSTCMIGASELVEPEEREAAGSFMGLCLVAGLTAGSLASFCVAGA